MRLIEIIDAQHPDDVFGFDACVCCRYQVFWIRGHRFSTLHIICVFVYLLGWYLVPCSINLIISHKQIKCVLHVRNKLVKIVNATVKTVHLWARIFPIIFISIFSHMIHEFDVDHNRISYVTIAAMCSPGIAWNRNEITLHLADNKKFDLKPYYEWRNNVIDVMRNSLLRLPLL